jgi:hypothetical protein
MGGCDQTTGATCGHPAAVLEELGHRRIPVGPVTAPPLEDADSVDPYRFDQSRHRLQLDQIVCELVDVKVLGVFDDPLLQCRSESTHLSSSNICSITLQDPQDRFQGVIGDILPGP